MNFNINMVVGLLIYPAAAVVTTIAASVYIWFEKPGIPMRYALRNAGLKVKYIQGATYRFCYAERGQKSPNSSTILLVHGFSASKDMWVGVVKKWPEIAHIIAVDLPGHGDTTPMPTGDGEDISFKHMVHSLHDFVHSVGLEEPFHIIGTSMGGAIAAMYSSLYAEDIERVTLSCPAVLPDPPVKTEFFKALEDGGGTKYLVPQTPTEMQGMMEHLMYCKEKVPKNKQVIKGILQLREPKSPFHAKLFAALRGERDSSDIYDILANIKAPTQIVWGKDDELLHYAGAEALQKLISTCQRVDILENCGHTIGWDRPGLFVKDVLEFRGDLCSKKSN